MDQFTVKAIAALQAIAKESPLNASRVARFGVAVEPATKTGGDKLDASR
jgi:hypothetical protein